MFDLSCWQAGLMDIVPGLIGSSPHAIDTLDGWAANTVGNWASEEGLLDQLMASGFVEKVAGTLKDLMAGSDSLKQAAVPELIKGLLEAAEAAGDVSNVATAVVKADFVSVLATALDKDELVDKGATNAMIRSLGLLAGTEEGRQAVESVVSSRHPHAINCMCIVQSGVMAAVDGDALALRLDRQLSGKEELEEVPIHLRARILAHRRVSTLDLSTAVPELVRMPSARL